MKGRLKRMPSIVLPGAGQNMDSSPLFPETRLKLLRHSITTLGELHAPERAGRYFMDLLVERLSQQINHGDT